MRDTDRDGVPDERTFFFENLRSPFGTLRLIACSERQGEPLARGRK